MSGQLCLRWNNHVSTFNKLLNNIYLEDTYSDATILCHGKFYPVHRFVLSTCSEYFEEMFRQCIRLNNKHPFIIVKDIHPDEMEALLNYMYKGEVNVPQEMLPELIKAAEAFKIKGLSVSDEEVTPKSRKRSNISSPSSVTKKSRKHENITDDNCKSTENNSKGDNSSPSSSFVQIGLLSKSNTEATPSLLEETIDKIKEEPVEQEEPIEITSVDTPAEEELPLKVETQIYDSFLENETNVEAFAYESSNDNYVEAQESTSWDNAQAYVNDDGTSTVDDDDPSQRLPDFDNWPDLPTSSGFNSNFEENRSRNILMQKCSMMGCSYQTRYKGDMKRHIFIHTGERPYKCPKCTYSAKQQGSITRHLKTVHVNHK